MVPQQAYEGKARESEFLARSTFKRMPLGNEFIVQIGTCQNDKGVKIGLKNYLSLHFE